MEYMSGRATTPPSQHELMREVLEYVATWGDTAEGYENEFGNECQDLAEFALRYDREEVMMVNNLYPDSPWGFWTKLQKYLEEKRKEMWSEVDAPACAADVGFEGGVEYVRAEAAEMQVKGATDIVERLKSGRTPETGIAMTWGLGPILGSRRLQPAAPSLRADAPKSEDRRCPDGGSRAPLSPLASP